MYEETIPAGTVGEFVKQSSNTLSVPEGYEVFSTTVIHGGNSRLVNILPFTWKSDNYIQAVNFYRANEAGGFVRFIVKTIYKKL